MSSLTVKDVASSDFDIEVLEASRSRAVVVDFWATWCAPCTQLSPILERVAARHAGEVDLVKVDVDQAPELARRFRVQGIPSVKAFRDGRVVSEFVGVQPEQAVEGFFAALVPSPVDRLVDAAAQAPPPERERLLREAVELQRDHAGALVALAVALAERDERDEARGLLRRVPADPAARRLLARLDLAAVTRPDEDDETALRERADAGDPQARLQLGRLLAARSAYEEALLALLAAVREPTTREEARAGVLQVFEVLGEGHGLVRAYRPKLASALF